MIHRSPTSAALCSQRLFAIASSCASREGKDHPVLFVIAARQPLELRARREVDDRVGALLRADHEEFRDRQQRLNIPRCGGPDVGGDRARMRAVGGHACARETACELAREEHVRQLGSRVSRVIL